MAHTATWYQYGIKHVLEGDVDLTDDTIKIALMKSTYVPDYAADHYMDDAGANDPIDEELNFGGGDTKGYFAGHGNSGRKTLANDTLSITGGLVKWDGDDLVWAALDAALADIHGALIHKEGAADDTDAILLIYVDFDPVFDPNGSDFNINWASGGIATMADA